jgi:hypothetical protein
MKMPADPLPPEPQHYSLNVSISILSEMPSGESDGNGSYGGNDIVG